jgi:hypothetical protein
VNVKHFKSFGSLKLNFNDFKSHFVYVSVSALVLEPFKKIVMMNKNLQVSGLALKTVTIKHSVGVALFQAMRKTNSLKCLR